MPLTDNLVSNKKQNGVFRVFICKNCGNEGIQKRQRTVPLKYCSSQCKSDYLIKNKRTEKICIVCNSKYSVDFKSAKKSVACSRICYDKYRGSLKIGSCSNCGKDVLGRQTNNKRKDFIFCSKKCSGIGRIKSKAPKDYQRKLFWHKVKNKESICCETCGIQDINILTVHHVDENRKNNDIGNLQLLCYNCHYKIHHQESVSLKKYIDNLNQIFN